MGICLIVKSGGGIDTSNANATASTIVSGYTCYVNDVLITGAMPKQTLTKELNPSSSQTISAGYYDGNSSKISVSTLSSVTGGTSVATSDVLTGYTYWSSGTKYTGSMTSRGTKTWTIGANGSQTIESGWHNGSGTVKQSIGVDNNEDWRTPKTSQQQLCWSGYYYSKNRGCYGNGNLVAGNIKKGISIFGVTGTYYVDPVKWVVQNGALCSGIGLESTMRYSPNDEGTPRWNYTTNTTPVTDSWQGNAYIRTMYIPSGNDLYSKCWYFTNVGGVLFNYTGSSASNWKIPSLHIDYMARGNDSRDLGIYYSFGGSSGGFLKKINKAIWTWYSDTNLGSISVTSVSSTISGGLSGFSYWDCQALKSGSIFIGITPGSSSYTFQFNIRNMWFDLSSYI